MEIRKVCLFGSIDGVVQQSEYYYVYDRVSRNSSSSRPEMKEIKKKKRKRKTGNGCTKEMPGWGRSRISQGRQKRRDKALSADPRQEGTRCGGSVSAARNRVAGRYDSACLVWDRPSREA
jgi:hypothetical protein